MKTLAGDRGIEWSFAMERLPVGKGSVLDFGPMNFNLSAHATLKGYDVVAIGLEDIGAPPNPRIRYIREDINSVDLGGSQFDYVLNVSTVEHVGLGRYGDTLGRDLDLAAMARLRGWMKKDSVQLLTVPIGQDAVVGYYHRCYGRERLPRLLEGYRVLEEKFYVKTDDDHAWVECSKERALDEVPGMIPEPSMLNLSYALGCMSLCKEK